MSDLFSIEIPHYIWKPTSLIDSFISYINNCFSLYLFTVICKDDKLLFADLCYCDGIKFSRFSRGGTRGNYAYSLDSFVICFVFSRAYADVPSCSI